MNTLVELNPKQHQALRVKANCDIEYASQLHMLNLRVAEVPRAIASFPVFFNKNPNSGDWMISAIASFVPGQNLFVKDSMWDAVYQPLSLRTFPFYLVQAEVAEQQYTVGIVQGSEAFSESEGERLFDENGAASLYLLDKQKLVESSLQEDVQTYHFCKKLNELGLIKAVDVVVQFSTSGPQTLKGLHTINEDALQGLSPEQLAELNRIGYLTPIHSMLASIFQLNALVQRNNKLSELESIDQVKLEVSRDRA